MYKATKSLCITTNKNKNNYYKNLNEKGVQTKKHFGKLWNSPKIFMTDNKIAKTLKDFLSNTIKT